MSLARLTAVGVIGQREDDEADSLVWYADELRAQAGQAGVSPDAKAPRIGEGVSVVEFAGGLRRCPTRRRRVPGSIGSGRAQWPTSRSSRGTTARDEGWPAVLSRAGAAGAPHTTWIVGSSLWPSVLVAPSPRTDYSRSMNRATPEPTAMWK